MKSVENWHAVSEKKTFKIRFYTCTKPRGKGRYPQRLIVTNKCYYFKHTMFVSAISL